MSKTARRDGQQFNPQALWVARNYVGLAVSQLAAEADISRALISAYENGSEKPGPLALGALAAVLNFPQAFFFRELEVPARDAMHFRKKKKVAEYVVSRARAKATVAGVTREALEEFADFDPPKLPYRNARAPEAIEKAAEEVRSALGLRLDTPLGDAIRTCEAAGVFVATFDALGAPIDGFAYWSRGVPVIMLNAAACWSRRRFSVLHELGHLTLHRDEIPDDKEDQANRFAGALLIPRAAFWREFPRPGRRYFDWAYLIEMKKRWGVSIQAIVVRARDLGLLDAAQYRTALIHISQVGWRTSEPAEMEPESPAVGARLLEAVSSHFGADSVAAAASLRPSVLGDVVGFHPVAEQEISKIHKIY